jgi:hypothetical protein
MPSCSNHSSRNIELHTHLLRNRDQIRCGEDTLLLKEIIGGATQNCTKKRISNKRHSAAKLQNDVRRT